MVWFTRGNFAFHAFRSFISTVAPQNPTFRCGSRIWRFGYSDSRSKGPYFSSFSSISQRLATRTVLARDRRFYYVDAYNVQHFKPRGAVHWFQNPRNLFFIAVMVGSGVFITLYVGSFETVPYTKRTHWILIPRPVERRLGEIEFDRLKAGFKGKILPPVHPESERVRMIAQDIIHALQRGLRKEKVWSDSEYASRNTVLLGEDNGRGALLGKDEGKWHMEEDEILDEKWVEQSRKKGQEQGKESHTSHLDGLNWEVLVVNEPHVNAFCLPGGKIVVFTGLLEHFRNDAEIATIIGHEVGHAVARHSAEGITKNLWFFILQLILYQVVRPDVVNTMSSLLLRLPFSRRMEMEADYIGLLLIASAGYDPRVAPQVYEKLGRLTRESMLIEYISTHPSGRKRAELLAQAKIMEEALTIYKNVRAGGGVEGFL